MQKRSRAEGNEMPESQGGLALRRLAPPQYKHSSFREGRERGLGKRGGKVRSRPQGSHAGRAEEQRPPHRSSHGGLPQEVPPARDPLLAIPELRCGGRDREAHEGNRHRRLRSRQTSSPSMLKFSTISVIAPVCSIRTG